MGENGKMRRSLTFTSANGLRRVVALVNSMTLLKADLAAEAKVLIEQFFARFQEAAEVDAKLKPFYDLTKGIFIEKPNFKVGPELHRFLGTPLDAEMCPELVEAQRLLTEALTSEKTNSYVRLYKRTSRADSWTPVSQS